MPGPIRCWLANFFCTLAVILLGGCAGNDREVYSQQQFQQLVNEGFLSPQIRNLDMLPVMTVQLYLDTPRIFLQGDGKPLMFHINGKVDADVFGGMVTEKLPVQITGFTQLRYSGDDEAIYFDQIAFMEARIDLEVALFKTMIVDSFQKALLKELAEMPLISLVNTPELSATIESLAKNNPDGHIQFDTREGSLVIEAVSGQGDRSAD
ncbi:hypothetical protein [Endozoicomonas sp. YOMI1]|uniref:hypothetical protein n=1 Tax=Endozoicomonas sp. YOMI1 TaxID=2828739 RepID=UPI0021476470|nr:hypothetical protein [Endozoicomonas sp. YOMI1]